MKIYQERIILVSFILGLVAVSACVSTPSPLSATRTTQPIGTFVISETSMSYEKDMFGNSYLIRGLVTNQLGRNESYVLVVCSVFDKDDIKLEYSNDAIGELGNLESARFEVEILESRLKGGYPVTFRCSAS